MGQQPQAQRRQLVWDAEKPERCHNERFGQGAGLQPEGRTDAARAKGAVAGLLRGQDSGVNRAEGTLVASTGARDV